MPPSIERLFKFIPAIFLITALLTCYCHNVPVSFSKVGGKAAKSSSDSSTKEQGFNTSLSSKKSKKRGKSSKMSKSYSTKSEKSQKVPKSFSKKGGKGSKSSKRLSSSSPSVTPTCQMKVERAASVVLGSTDPSTYQGAVDWFLDKSNHPAGCSALTSDQIQVRIHMMFAGRGVQLIWGLWMSIFLMNVWSVVYRNASVWQSSGMPLEGVFGIKLLVLNGQLLSITANGMDYPVLQMDWFRR